MAAKRGPRAMSDEHKRALEKGRAEGRAVRDYLEALRSTKPKRGRKRTPDSIKKRLAEIDRELVDASAIAALQLGQQRRDLAAELEAMGSGVDVTAPEAACRQVAQA